MSSVSAATSNSQQRSAPAPVACITELVSKIETSATSSRKRISTARKKLSKVIKEQRRYARELGLRAVSMTLTYSSTSQFASKHISRFLDTLRKALRRRGQTLPYAWTLERAGRLHYHLIVWLPHGCEIDKAKLKRWWPWGSTWIDSCRSPKAWGRYIAKFDDVTNLPKRSRAYGYGGLDEAGRTAVTRACLPRWLALILPKGHSASRSPGGGWFDTTTGAIYKSPYIWTPRGIVGSRANLTPRGQTEGVSHFTNDH